MKYLYVIEQADGNLSAYVPDLPGCVATGANRKEVEENVRIAIDMHLSGMREDKTPIPAPSTDAAYADVG